MLGIHPAIPLPDDADPGLSRELPLYVPRDVHARLTTWITAKQRSGGLLLLVGPAGAGKTRCVYEALLGKVPDAEILIPETVNQLEALAQASGGGEAMVVWLNEIYDLLGPDKLTADLMRRILNHRRPLLLVATIWTQRWNDLTGGEPNEINRDAREILTVLCDVEHLPGRFSQEELARAQRLKDLDPRWHEALAVGTADVVGVLASKSRLLAHWQDPPDPYGHAVLDAAITALQCGARPPIPVSILEPVAAARLDPAARANAAPGWFMAALEVECRKLAGLKVAALEASAATPGGGVDGYRPHDILTQNIEVEVPDELARIVIEFATPRMCFNIVAKAIRNEKKIELAIEASRKAATDPNPSIRAMSILALGSLLDKRGDTAQARVAYEQALDSGDIVAAPTAAAFLGVLLSAQAEMARSCALLRQALSYGATQVAPMAALNLGLLLVKEGDGSGAERAFQQAIGSDQRGYASTALLGLAILMAMRGDVKGAEAVVQQAVLSGDIEVEVGGIFELAFGILKSEFRVGAEDAFREVVELGSRSHASLVAFVSGLAAGTHPDSDLVQAALRNFFSVSESEVASRIALAAGIRLAACGASAAAQGAFQQVIDSGNADLVSRAARRLDQLKTRTDVDQEGAL